MTEQPPTDQAADRPICEHHWISHHQPDFPEPIYWVSICSQCGDINAADLAEQIMRPAVEQSPTMRARYAEAMESAWSGDLHPISVLGNDHEALRARVAQLEAVACEDVLNHLTFEDLQAAGYRDRVAELETMCHWTRGVGTARDETHFAYHYGSVCPYTAMGAVLRGEPDPRDDVAEWRIDLPFATGKPPISLNDRSVHWAVHASKVDKVKAITRNAIRDADVPQLGHAHIELHYRGRTNAVRDADNYVATLKVCIDAMHHEDDRSKWVPILKGDDARYVSWSRPQLHPAIRGAGAATWLIIRSNQGAEAIQEALL